MPHRTFKAKIIKGKITIPGEIRDYLDVWEGDEVKVTVEKVTEEEGIRACGKYAEPKNP